MGCWYRTAALSEADENPKSERWEYRRSGGVSQSFEVEVRVGKAFDVLALKGAQLDDVRDYASFLANTATTLYGSDSAVETLEHCPICETSLAKAQVELRVFGVAYVRCPVCRHVLVEGQPAGDILNNVFEDSEEHSFAYVDLDALEVRMAEIIAPKLNWSLACYRDQYGGIPQRFIDVGAGGGHFVAGVQREGFAGEGFEKSQASRAFADEAFGLKLRDDDFLTSDVASAEIITFWGLLEYVQQPRSFLAAARKILAPEGLLIVEVPRVDCLGTLVQSRPEAVVARHMDPTSHINGFSDESLCTALVEEGFAPVAAWYFGMDAWETMIQFALHLGDDTVAERLNMMVPILQKAADRGRQCDDIVIAAVPLKQT